ncbi:MAG: hypothetical protein Q8N10_03315 [Phenylobacterium sp.]|uniref:hypothetical protein n=1 Tax=Phenylobacterium sp. TaxID=1871053 RepID=UPI0027212A77|nr:hypothetical protein [Phenylobacterium sp.]MDO8912299.1 hypothetical protein [Phenylobacterium sp.]MDP3099511.1 hypothetical protein [Phenylobacterium sp.]
MIALILGGAPSVFEEVRAAAALIGRRHMVVAANLAGIHWPGKLDAWATEHPECLGRWRSERKGPAAARYFVPAGLGLCPWAEQVRDRWNGSSGLYAAQCALTEVGATAIILCGIPMDSEAGHFINPGSWAGTGDYRWGFEAALREFGGRIRSMGGWTAGLFGKPSPEWVGAVENIKPLGSTAPQHARIAEMHTITNTGKSSAKFWAKDERGQLQLQRLAPGESVDAEIDPNQPKFIGGDLKLSGGDDAAKPATRTARPKAAAKPKARAARAAPTPAPVAPADEG